MERCRCHVAIAIQGPHLDVSVDADGGIVDAFQTFEGHRALLLVVDEEDDDPSREIQEYSDCGSVRNAAIRPVWREEQQIKNSFKENGPNNLSPVTAPKVALVSQYHFTGSATRFQSKSTGQKNK